MTDIAGDHSVLRTTPQPCTMHREHKPASHLNHRHHVWPLGLGGPDIEDNIIVICPTGHSNIHDLMKHYQIHRGKPPYSIVRRYSFKEREYALLGYRRSVRKSM